MWRFARHHLPIGGMGLLVLLSALSCQKVWATRLLFFEWHPQHVLLQLLLVELPACCTVNALPSTAL